MFDRKALLKRQAEDVLKGSNRKRAEGRDDLKKAVVLDLSYKEVYVVDRRVPRPFCGSGRIRLVILGQDPTVKSSEARGSIATVLNLDKKGRLRSYIKRMCDGLGIDLDVNVYATNVVKNFFTEAPTQIKEVDVLREASQYWIALLKDEVDCFPHSVVVSLGEPVLSVLVSREGSTKLRDYWGYTKRWKAGKRGEFGCIDSELCVLKRSVFPFPHQPSIIKRFYKDRLKDYVSYVRSQF